jgi:hypothetical protein
VIGRKIPVLLTFPAKQQGDSIKEILQNANGKIQDSVPFRVVSSPNLLLQKLLSRARIFSLKTENKTSQWLEQLRKKSQEKKALFSEDYWKQLKKGKERKKVS